MPPVVSAIVVTRVLAAGNSDAEIVQRAGCGRVRRRAWARLLASDPVSAFRGDAVVVTHHLPPQRPLRRRHDGGVHCWRGGAGDSRDGRRLEWHRAWLQRGSAQGRCGRENGSTCNFRDLRSARPTGCGKRDRETKRRNECGRASEQGNVTRFPRSRAAGVYIGGNHGRSVAHARYETKADVQCSAGSTRNRRHSCAAAAAFAGTSSK
jgi:hypothetical protein